jgi:hypothetical protein
MNDKYTIRIEISRKEIEKELNFTMPDSAWQSITDCLDKLAYEHEFGVNGAQVIAMAIAANPAIESELPEEWQLT